MYVSVGCFYFLDEAVRRLDTSPSLHSPRHTSSGCATFSPSDAEKGIEAERVKSHSRREWDASFHEGDNPCSKQERAGGVDRHSCRALDASFTRRHSAGVRHLTTDLPQSRRTGGITVHAISRTRLSTRGTVRALHILPRLIGCPRRRGWRVVCVVIGTVRVMGGTCRVAGTRLPGVTSALRMAGGLNSLAGMDE